MNKLLAGLALLLVSACSHAGYNDRFIDAFGHVLNNQPAEITIDSFAYPNLVVSSTLPITAGSQIFVLAHDCASPPGGGGSVTQAAAAESFGSGTITVDWVPEGSTVCLTASHRARGKRSDPQTTASFTVPVTGGGGGAPIAGQVNWNPGVYLGIKPDQFFLVRGDYEGGWRSAESVIGPMAICDASGALIRGVRVKLEWAEYENVVGDYSSGDELMDDILAYSESRACNESSPGAGDGRTFQIALVADPKAFDFVSNGQPTNTNRFKAVAGGVNGPFANDVDMVCRQGNGGSIALTCGARVYDPASGTGVAYQNWGIHVRDRYGSSPLFEMIGMRIEGSSSVYNKDPLFGTGAIFQEFARDFNVMMRDGGNTRSWVNVGTNNYRAGHNDQLITIHLPSMNATGGQGVSHPDTFEDVPPGQSAHAPFYPATNGSINGGPAGVAQHAHWAEFQRAGRTFSSIPGVIEQCCDPTYLNPSSILSAYTGTSDPSTTAYGATHAVIITTFGQYPVSDFIAEFNSRPRGWELFDSSCPDAWLAAGLTCVDSSGTVAP